jgi:hypothetical protein
VLQLLKAATDKAKSKIFDCMAICLKHLKLKLLLLCSLEVHYATA